VARTPFDVMSARLSAHASEARCKQASLMLGTELAGVLHGKIEPS
jgi:hypothetical protein